jgi:hypothetical protein
MIINNKRGFVAALSLNRRAAGSILIRFSVEDIFLTFFLVLSILKEKTKR